MNMTHGYFQHRRRCESTMGAIDQLPRGMEMHSTLLHRNRSDPGEMMSHRRFSKRKT